MFCPLFFVSFQIVSDKKCCGLYFPYSRRGGDVEPEERRGALPPRSSVCPVNRAISCFNKHIYWECVSFSVVSLSALSHRTVGQSRRRKATRRTTRCRENTRGRWPSSEWWRLKSVSTMGKLAEGFTQGRVMPGRGDLKDWETGMTRGGIGCLARDHPLKGRPIEGCTWGRGVWRRGKPAKGQTGEKKTHPRVMEGSMKGRPWEGRPGEGQIWEMVARRRAGPGKCGPVKGRPVTRGRAVRWRADPSKGSPGEGQTRQRAAPAKGGRGKGRVNADYESEKDIYPSLYIARSFNFQQLFFYDIFLHNAYFTSYQSSKYKSIVVTQPLSASTWGQLKFNSKNIQYFYPIFRVAT